MGREEASRSGDKGINDLLVEVEQFGSHYGYASFRAWTAFALFTRHSPATSISSSQKPSILGFPHFSTYIASKMITILWNYIANAVLWLLPASVYSPPSSAGFNSEHTSPIYPDRPIRPLPKKPLRSRLSPEMADSILYPPAPPTSRPAFYISQKGPTHQSEGSKVATIRGKDGLQQQRNALNFKAENKDGYEEKGDIFDSDEEDGVGIMRRYQEQRIAHPSAQRNFVNGGARADIAKYPKAPNLQSTASSADSVDGYDSFENTNNKKKRKIPTSGNLGNHQASLSTEMAQMGIHSTRDMDPFDAAQEPDGGVSQYYGSGSSAIPASSSGTGISGAGRGRFGRSGARPAGGRSPLGVSTNGSNALNSARNALLRHDMALSEVPDGKGDNLLVVLHV